MIRCLNIYLFNSVLSFEIEKIKIVKPINARKFEYFNYVKNIFNYVIKEKNVTKQEQILLIKFRTNHTDILN